MPRSLRSTSPSARPARGSRTPAAAPDAEPGGPDASGSAAALLEVLPTVMAALRAAMRRQLGQGLSVPQFRCLRHIADNPGVSVSDVAAFLGVTLATASAMLDRLARAGYVAARVSRDDRRRSVLTVTAPGRALMGRIRRGAQAELALSLAPASGEQLSALHAGLEVLKQRFDHGA